MPTLSINGQNVQVGDDFMSLSPTEQNATVAKLAADAGIAPSAAVQQPQGNFGLTAAIRGIGGLLDAIPNPLSPIRRLISPDLERMEQSSMPGQMAGNAAFRILGTPEYQPTSPSDRAALAAATGAVGGAPFGVVGSTIGALGGGLGQAVGDYTGSERLGTAASLAPGGILALSNARPQLPAAPSAAALKSAGGAGFDAAGNLGVEVSSQPLVNMAQRLHNELLRDSFRNSPKSAAETFDFLERLSNVSPSATAKFADLHIMRRTLQGIINDNLSGRENASPSDAAAAYRVKGELDNFISNLGQTPQYLVAGTPAAAQTLSDVFREALGNYSASQKANAISGELDRARTGIGERAEARAQATGSGQNFDNALRQRIESFLEQRRNVSGFTDAELAALDQMVQGSRTQNFLRGVGNTLGGGRGLGALGSAATGGLFGSMAGDPATGIIAGAAFPAAGMAAKMGENMIARRNLGNIEDMIRQNSPLYRQQLGQMSPRDIEILRALLPGMVAPFGLAPLQPAQ